MIAADGTSSRQIRDISPWKVSNFKINYTGIKIVEKKIKRVRSFRSEQFPHFDARIYRFLVASCIASSSLVTSCCCSLFRLHFDRQTAITHHESAEKHRFPKYPRI